MKKLPLLALCLAALADRVPGARAEALCTASVASPMQFVSVAPFGSNVYDTWTTLTVHCTGVTPQRTVALCPSIGAGSGGASASGQRLLALDGAGTIPFQIFQNSAHSRKWGSAIDAAMGDPPLLTLSSDGDLTATLYFQLYTGGAPLAPGTHLSSFDGLSAMLRFGEALTAPSSCAAAGATLGRSAVFPFAAQAPIAASCLLNVTQNIDFGNFTTTAANRDASGALSVQCTAGTTYTVSLSLGNGAGATAAARKMTGPNGATMTYGLYRDPDHAHVWDQTKGSDTAGRSGSGAPVSFPVYGRVPHQPTPPPGTYSDTVIATVTY